MTKKELVAAVSEKTGLTKKDSEAALSAILDAISESLSKGNDVQLTGFGTFEVKDRPARSGRNPATGETETLDFPTKSNVLQFFTVDGSKISIRPSGTEPKIKFYVEVHDTMKDKADYERCNKDAAAKIARIKQDLGI